MSRGGQALFTAYGFRAPLLVGLLQMAIIAPVCYLVARPRVDVSTARACAPLALVNVLNLVCGLVGAPFTHHLAACFRLLCSAALCSVEVKRTDQAQFRCCA